MSFLVFSFFCVSWVIRLGGTWSCNIATKAFQVNHANQRPHRIPRQKAKRSFNGSTDGRQKGLNELTLPPAAHTTPNRGYFSTAALHEKYKRKATRLRSEGATCLRRVSWVEARTTLGNLAGGCGTRTGGAGSGWSSLSNTASNGSAGKSFVVPSLWSWTRTNKNLSPWLTQTFSVFQNHGVELGQICLQQLPTLSSSEPSPKHISRVLAIPYHSIQSIMIAKQGHATGYGYFIAVYSYSFFWRTLFNKSLVFLYL